MLSLNIVTRLRINPYLSLLNCSECSVVRSEVDLCSVGISFFWGGGKVSLYVKTVLQICDLIHAIYFSIRVCKRSGANVSHCYSQRFDQVTASVRLWRGSRSFNKGWHQCKHHKNFVFCVNNPCVVIQNIADTELRMFSVWHQIEILTDYEGVGHSNSRFGHVINKLNYLTNGFRRGRLPTCTNREDHRHILCVKLKTCLWRLLPQKFKF